MSDITTKTIEQLSVELTNGNITIEVFQGEMTRRLQVAAASKVSETDEALDKLIAENPPIPDKLSFNCTAENCPGHDFRDFPFSKEALRGVSYKFSEEVLTEVHIFNSSQKVTKDDMTLAAIAMKKHTVGMLCSGHRPLSTSVWKSEKDNKFALSLYFVEKQQGKKKSEAGAEAGSDDAGAPRRGRNNAR